MNDKWITFISALLLAAIAATPPTIMAWATLQRSNETHDLVNSRMTEMLSLVKAKATAEATLKEKARHDELPNRHDKDRK